MEQKKFEKREKPITGVRLNILGFGSLLLTAFLVSVSICAIRLIIEITQNGFLATLKERWIAVCLIILFESIIFWVGIIMVYTTSVQLGIKLRVIGIICGWIPIVHIIVLILIIKTTISETVFEKIKLNKNRKRITQQICKTKYPILMVHGVFFRDFKYFNYWGRVPGELEKNGATIYYGNHQSAAAVSDSAGELAARIRQIVESTGCEKLNVIAHSKGGLDMKMAIATRGVAEYVASLTTVNTPHKGCEFAEYLLEKAPAGMKEKVAAAYNSALHRMGDENPDFIAAVTDLTSSGCRKISEAVEGFDFQKNGIYTRSIGSCMKKASGGAFPLNMSYHLVGWFDGRNDGLVGEGSFKWGEDYIFLENKKKRGISHGDMIDLNRENISGFDVREFYVDLVARLRERGL